MSAKIVYLDIERQSGVVDGIWDLKQTSWLSPHQIIERPRTICFAWRWDHENETHFAAEWDRGGHKAMIRKAHQVMNDADYLVGWNSKAFDVKHLRTEMITHGMTPPAPHKDIDLMLVARRQFKFLSNRMAYIAEQLDQNGKMATGGSELWKLLRTAKGDQLAKARQKMADYNRRDVELTMELWGLLKPWATGINIPVFDPQLGALCPVCSSDNIQYRGLARTTTHTYRRFQCNDCGKWGRDTSSVSRVNSVPLSQ